MAKYNYQHLRRFSVWQSAIALMLAVSLPFPAFARGGVDRASSHSVSASKQANSQAEPVVVTGSAGQYTGRIEVQAPVEIAWEVLTDYDNFDSFLPNVAESRLLSSNGNRKVFEQVNIAKFLFVQKTARIRIEATETYPQQITFRAIEGDVKSLQGVWKINVLSDRVLVEHQVAIDPGPEDRNLFFAVYQNNLKSALEALQQEIKRRS